MDRGIKLAEQSNHNGIETVVAPPVKGDERMERDELQTWITQRAQEDDRLYERYGRVLEVDHSGESVAISPDGRLILGPEELTVATEALRAFGPGAFALRRIGADAEVRWRSHR